MLEKMINGKAVAAVRELLAGGKRFVVLAHKNPDGDAVGSSLALCHYIAGLGKDVIIRSPQKVVRDYQDYLKQILEGYE
jgi:phosphoesterase RecJ-like protein